MSIYNHTVLKSNPVKVCIPMHGAEWEVPVYRVKWHGKDTWFDWGDDRYPFKQAGDQSVFDILSRRAERAWGGDKPTYIVCTGAHYDGKLHWEDPDHTEKGFKVYESDMISFQESEAFQKCIGRIVKVGRGKYKFIPKE